LRLKLRPPAVGPHYVRRPRLLELLDEVVAQPLTVVMAPAGAGKTSLLAGWAAESDVGSAWLSLDASDRDGVQLWSGVMAALDRLAPGCGGRASTGLRRRGALLEAVGQFLEDLDELERAPAVLIIDDVHWVDGDDLVAASLALFVEHLPAWLHLVLATRREPKLPLDRLRAQGRIGEIRFNELRFSTSEARELLARLAPSLDDDILAAAADRADGWAASLQLAALAARSSRASAALTPPPAGDTALVRDYVFREVLATEAPEVVEALLDVAVVERVNPGLASALTGRVDAGPMLEEAETRGLFVNRLGPEGWFGVHSLVRSVLVGELAERAPARLAAQHRRAARWFEENGEVPLALDHLLLAGEPRQALRLLATEHAALFDSGREATTLRTIAALPASATTADFDGMLQYAWCHLLVSRRRFLELVEQMEWWAAQAPIDETLQARLTMLQSVATTMDGRWKTSGALARQAMTQMGAGWWQDPLGRFGWNVIARELALAESWDGRRADVREAELALSRDPERRLSFEGTRALGEALAGRPLEALRVAAGVRHTASVANMTSLRVELATAEAIARRELGDHGQAVAELEALARAPAESMIFCRLLAALELVQAHLDHADEDAAGEAFAAARTLVEAEALGADACRALAQVGTLVALAGADLDEACRWARGVDDPFWGGITRARVHLAAGAPERASSDLDTVVPRSPRHGVLLALLRSRAADNADDALKYATAAVELGAPLGILQTVATEGADVLDVIEQAAWRASPPWMDRLRRAAVAFRSDSRRSRGEQDFGLTDRERDVLRFLPSRLTVREIANELYVSVNTLKFHLKIIYRKLGVSSRAEAAEMARRLTDVRR
jgi:LuxR family maltose regulon positive regulatory protein